MISLGVIKFFFYLALPYLLTRGIGWLTGNGKARKGAKTDSMFSMKPLTPKETFVYSVALIAIFNYILAIYGSVQKPSFFQMVNCPTNAPTFLVREHYQAYCQQRADESELFKEAMKIYEESGSPSLGSEDDPSGGAYKRHRYAFREPFYLPYLRWMANLFSGSISDYQSKEEIISEEQLEFEHLTYLFDRLKMPSRRTIYLKYGEEAFLDGSSFCRDDNDYILFLAPSSLFTYIQFLLVVGIITTLPKKSNWRSIMVLFAVVLLVCEVLFFVAPQEMEGSLQLFEFLSSKDMQEQTTTTQKLELTRKFLFGAAILLILLMDNGNKVSDVDLLSHVQEKLETTLSRDHTLKMMRQAVFSNTILRDFYMKQVVDAESHSSTNGPLYKNADFIKATEKIVDQYDLDKMAKMTQDDLQAVLESIPAYSSQKQAEAEKTHAD